MQFYWSFFHRVTQNGSVRLRPGTREGLDALHSLAQMLPKFYGTKYNISMFVTFRTAGIIVITIPG